MNYKEYQNARDCTWKLLIRLGISELPIRPGEICKSLGIAVRFGDLPPDNDGLSFFAGQTPIIVVSSNVPLERQRFTAAHELGHILLDHVGKYELVNREPTSLDNPIEQAANVFASRLLDPACVLWGCGATSADQIAALCNISLPAAQFRAERMAVLYQRNKFLVSLLERQVYKQFSEYITAHGL